MAELLQIRDGWLWAAQRAEGWDSEVRFSSRRSDAKGARNGGAKTWKDFHGERGYQPAADKFADAETGAESS